MVCRFCRKHHTGNILPNQHGITIYKAGQKNSQCHVQSKHMHAFIHSQNPVIDRAKTTDFLLNPFPSKRSVTVGKERKGEESRKALQQLPINGCRVGLATDHVPLWLRTPLPPKQRRGVAVGASLQSSWYLLRQKVTKRINQQIPMKLSQKNIQFLSLKCYHLRIIC